jgi:hypothetical protein
VARALPTLLVLALLGASAAAFAVTEGKKLEKTPITKTFVGNDAGLPLFSPVCECAKDHVAIRFRLRKADRLTVTIRHDGDTPPVATLVEDKPYRRGWVKLTWNGMQPSGIAVPDGVYEPAVHLVRQHRTIVLPNPIQVDTVAPRVLAVQPKPLLLSPDGDGRGDVLTVRYRLGEKAHGVLYVDRRQAVFSKFARTADRLQFYGKVHGKPLSAGPHPLTFAAEDAAGNLSKPQRIGTLTIRYVTLARHLVSIGPGERFYLRVSADAKRVDWRFAGRTGAARPGTLVLRAPKKPGTYRLYVSAGDHADVAKVKVERIR